MTKARACKGAGQEKSPEIASHALENVGECEGMNPFTPKGTPTLGNWSLVELPNFQKAIVEIKTQWIEELFISLEIY
jgi:hypothetical protein